jgi:hypothetical protein
VFGKRNPEGDASLRRIERDSAIACLVTAAAAVVVQRGGLSGALGVAGGGALMAFSYREIRAGVDAIVLRTAPADGAAPPSGGRVLAMWPILRFVLRYGVMGLGAWLLLVPLHAHPVGVVAGVSAPVVAMAIEAIRLLRRG